MNGKDTVIGNEGGWIKLRVLLASMAVGLLLCAQAVAQLPRQTALVADVKVFGNHNVPTAVVLNHLKTRKGRVYSLATMVDDARRLATDIRAFRDVRPREHRTPDGRVIVEFHVEEYPNLVQEVKVFGNRHMKLTDLEELKSIRKGSTLNPLLNRQAALKIEDKYREKGYLFATVKLLEGGKQGDHKVIFSITEGPVVKIRSIRFTGNDTLATAARLRTQIMSSQSILRLLGGDYNPRMIAGDIDKLRKYYMDNGYLNVKISREVKFSEDHSMVDIIFHIHEGTHYRIGKITVDGVKNLPKAQVESILKSKEGQGYNGTDIETDTNRIKALYGWRGYQARAVKELYAIDGEPGLIHVKYRVVDKPQPPDRVGQVIIIGNLVTKDRVIRRALLGLYPGQILRYPELRIAEQNLQRLNLFETNPSMGVRPTVTAIPNPNSQFKDILVRIKETYTGSFMVGVGVNSNAGLVGSIVLNERNFDLFRPPTSLADIFEGRAFRGGGQEFRLSAIPGIQLQRYSVSLTEPFLFDLPYSLTSSGYYYTRIFNEYTERRVGGRFTIGHQFNPNWRINGSLRLEDVHVGSVPNYAPIDYTSVIGDHFVIGPRVGVVRDSRDSYLRPTEGNFTEVSFEQVFGSFTYPIANIETNQYFTVTQRKDGSGRHVLAARGQVSWQGQHAPVYDRFFAGGYNSLRGFRFRGVGPFINGFNVGGHFMMLASLEYQLPVMANDNLYLVAFLDSGTVERNLQINNYRVTAGVGARFVVPMIAPVPIALDFGIPIVKGPGDRTQLVAFYFGIIR